MPSTNTNVRAHRSTRALHAVPNPAGRTAAEDKLWAALHAHPASTASDLAAHAGIGHSTAGKILAAWATDGSVTRTSRPAQAGRRAADTWTITDTTRHHAAEPTLTDQPDRETTNTAPDTGTEETKASDPGTAKQPPTSVTPTSTDTPRQTTRLGKGALRGIVEDYLTEHLGEQFSPSAIGKALKRSSGAVANICGSSDDQVAARDVPEWLEQEVTEVLAELESEGRVVRVDSDGDGRWRLAECRRARLPQGGLQGLVEDFLAGHPGDAFGPHAIGTALGRSSGAVANALVRLTERGAAVQTCERPRRYSAAARE